MQHREIVPEYEKQNVGILIFPFLEVLDFTGPYEVFARTRTQPGAASRRSEESAPFKVFTVAKTLETIVCTGGLKVVPHYDFESCPNVSILIVPGGFGTRPLLNDKETLEWIRKTHMSAMFTASVCTGALLLAKLGLLSKQRATTHWAALETLRQVDESIIIEQEKRVILSETGIFTSAGVSAGIDMAFSLVEKLCGKQIADETAKYIEYPRQP